MKFSILVLGAPFSNQAAYSAYRFVEAMMETEHTIHRVFFYQDGIHTSSALATPPQDEHDLYEAWQDLIASHKIECFSCIAAAARRGVIDAAEADRHGRPANNLAKGFELAGLGQLVEAMVVSDRLVTFGK